MAKKEIKSEVAGVILEIATIGQQVNAEDELAVIEAMKMEIPLISPVGGTVASVHVAEGATIGEGELIVTIETARSERW